VSGLDVALQASNGGSWPDASTSASGQTAAKEKSSPGASFLATLETSTEKASMRGLTGLHLQLE
jgi:hypothetical protein